MNDDGFGMTSDMELNIYGFMDQEAIDVISKLHYYTGMELDSHILDKVRKQDEASISKTNNHK